MSFMDMNTQFGNSMFGVVGDEAPSSDSDHAADAVVALHSLGLTLQSTFSGQAAAGEHLGSWFCHANQTWLAIDDIGT